MTIEPTPTSPAPPAPAPEQRVSTVVGDRLCIKCHFNLSGQPVTRESVYGMTIVRCPECSTVAALQEYPVLGKWANRFAAALAAVWLLALIGGIFATGGTFFGLTQGCLETGGGTLAVSIAQAHSDWYADATPAERARISAMYGGAGTRALPVYAHSWIDATWWGTQDISTYITKLGGIAGALDSGVLEVLFWLVFVAVVIGALWSVFLLHVRRHRLFVFFLLPLAFSLLFCYISSQSPSRTTFWMGGTAVFAMHLAQSALWSWIVSVALVGAYVGLCIGAWFGRPFIRWLARLLLPPRMQNSLAYLWIAEGKTPPRPRPAARAAIQPPA